MRQREKKAVLAALERGKHLLEAARLIKRDPATLWKWRQADPGFDAAVREHCEENEAARVSVVEEVLYQRILQDKASATEIIFFLTQRARTRWRNHHSKDTLDEGGNSIDQVSLGQLQAIAAKIDKLETNLTPEMAAQLLGVGCSREVLETGDGQGTGHVVFGAGF